MGKKGQLGASTTRVTRKQLKEGREKPLTREQIVRESSRLRNKKKTETLPDRSGDWSAEEEKRFIALLRDGVSVRAAAGRLNKRVSECVSKKRQLVDRGVWL